MTHDVIEALAAEGPDGLFSRGQLLEAGFTDRHIHRWVRQGRMVRLAPGWFRAGGAPVPEAQHLTLVREYFRGSAKRPEPFITGRAALAASGVTGFPLSCRPLVAIPWRSRVRIRQAPFDTIQSHTMSPRDVVEVDGRRVARPARAVADLALWEEPSTADLADVVYAVKLGARVTTASLCRDWSRLGRHAGAARLRRVAETGRLDVESAAEWDLLTCFRAQPPVPDPQVWVTDHHRVDFVFASAGLIVEYHGEEAHKDRLDADAYRIAALRALGWEVIVITASLLREPERTVDMVHRVRCEREVAIAHGVIRRPLLPLQRDRRAGLTTLHPAG